MSYIKATNKAKWDSALVLKAELFESFESFKNMMDSSNKFLEIYELSQIFYKKQSKFNKKQITTMEIKMDKLFHKIINTKNTKLDDIVTLAGAYYNVCVAYMGSNQKEELHIAENAILRCLNLIKDKELDPKSILLSLKAHYCLGIFYYKQNKTKESIQIYDKALDFYFAYISAKNENRNSIDLKHTIVKSATQLDNQRKLEDIYINILNVLVELHVHIKPTNNPSLIIYIHFLLIAEWHKLPENKEYFKWICKATALCVYLLKYNRFQEAKYYIIVAIYLKTTYIDIKCDCIEDEKIPSKVCEWCSQSKIAFNLFIIYQVKYAVAFLCESAERLLRLEKNDDSETDNLKLENSIKSKELFLHKLLFGIENTRSNPNEHETLRVKYILHYYEAHHMFADILNLLYDAGLHCSTGDIKTYESIILDTCKAYKYMALFEKNTTSRMLLHKRRVEILIDAIKLVNSKDRNVTRHLQLQLAITYSTLVDIKFENFMTSYSQFVPSRHNNVLVKINDLLEKGLMNILLYMGC